MNELNPNLNKANKEVTMESVSYTHLDVYKRQVSSSMAFWFRRLLDRTRRAVMSW